MRGAPLGFAKEFHSKDQKEIERPINKGRKSSNKSHPDWWVQEEWVIYAGVGVVDPRQNIGTVGRFHHPERGDRIANH